MSVPDKLRYAAATLMTIIGALAVTTAATAVGVQQPAAVSYTANPGDVISFTETVTTPQLPPKPDVVLLVDRTGSMGGAINNVKANVAGVIDSVKASQPDAQFAVAQYCDFGEPVPAFQMVQGLTADANAITAAVNSIALCDGGDLPEAQLNALWEIGSGAVAFRPDSSRIVAWFGDAPGHDPSGGHAEADAIAALQSVQAKVVAVSVGLDQLDATGQATRVITATRGNMLTGVESGQVSAKILEGLNNLDVTMSAAPTCDPGLTLGLEPPSQTVASGGTAVFGGSITVGTAASTGTRTCRLEFTLNGKAGGPEFVRTLRVKLADATPPNVSCAPGSNPAGTQPGATNEDGFFRMVATDAVDPDVRIYVRDTASNLRFGPYASGTTFKLTQAPGGKVEVKPFVGVVTAKFTLNGAAELIGIDSSGNTATALCAVPPRTA